MFRVLGAREPEAFTIQSPMSFHQIWNRFTRLVRSQRISESHHSRDDLRRAEVLIREANERDRAEELKKFGSTEPPNGTKPEAGKPVRHPSSYEAACRTLGVAPDASLESIVRAYRAGIALHHPDRVPSGDPDAVHAATGRTQQLNAAFAVVRRFRTGRI